MKKRNVSRALTCLVASAVLAGGCAGSMPQKQVHNKGTSPKIDVGEVIQHLRSSDYGLISRMDTLSSGDARRITLGLNERVNSEGDTMSAIDGTVTLYHPNGSFKNQIDFYDGLPDSGLALTPLGLSSIDRARSHYENADGFVGLKKPELQEFNYKTMVHHELGYSFVPDLVGQIIYEWTVDQLVNEK